MPINFKITPTGGSCAPGCHRQQTYTREAVKIPVKEPASIRPVFVGPPEPQAEGGGSAAGEPGPKP
jgi:hypothetical protein